MILPRDFRTAIDPIGQGVRIRITHEPTGAQVERGVPRGGSVKEAERQLRAQLLSRFFQVEEFELRSGRAVGGSFHEVVHLPTGRRQRRFYAYEQKVPADIRLQLIDALLTEAAGAEKP